MISQLLLQSRTDAWRLPNRVTGVLRTSNAMPPWLEAGARCNRCHRRWLNEHCKKVSCAANRPVTRFAERDHDTI